MLAVLRRAHVAIEVVHHDVLRRLNGQQDVQSELRPTMSCARTYNKRSIYSREASISHERHGRRRALAELRADSWRFVGSQCDVSFRRAYSMRKMCESTAQTRLLCASCPMNSTTPSMDAVYAAVSLVPTALELDRANDSGVLRRQMTTSARNDSVFVHVGQIHHAWAFVSTPAPRLDTYCHRKTLRWISAPLWSFTASDCSRRG